jgi:hypothetical protein
MLTDEEEQVRYVVVLLQQPYVNATTLCERHRLYVVVHDIVGSYLGKGKPAPDFGCGIACAFVLVIDRRNSAYSLARLGPGIEAGTPEESAVVMALVRFFD